MGYIILIILGILLLRVLYKWGSKKVAYHLWLDRNLDVDYPKSEYTGKARADLKKRLLEFNVVFYKQYPQVVEDDFNSIFTDYPKMHSKQMELDRRIQMYETLNLKKKAIEMLKKVLPVKLTLESQIEYFKKELLIVERTRTSMNQEKFHSFFPILYAQRRRILQAVENNCKKTINKLQLENDEFDKAITELENMKKKHFLMKVGEFAFNVVTAPIRHVSNIVGGVMDNDPGRVGKSATILVLSAVGVGIAFDAIDGFEGLSGSGDLALDVPVDTEVGQHFVEPHSRILADGTEIWVDGDGDSSVNLTTEEGGGYYRSNPRG